MLLGFHLITGTGKRRISRFVTPFNSSFVPPKGGGKKGCGGWKRRKCGGGEGWGGTRREH